MGRLLQDLKYGTRMLIKQPAFTIVAILTLALGIGANSAIFSVVNAVLLRPLQLQDPEQLVKLYEKLPQGGTGSVSVPNLKDWREQNDVVTDIAAYQFAGFSMQGQERPERVVGATVTANLFNVLGVPPRIGRTFAEGEDQPGKNNVVLLSNQLWQRSFGADPNVVGTSILLSGENYTVAGVMPPGFQFPSNTVELWVPVVFTPNQLSNRGNHAFQTIGRLKPGVTLAQAQEQMSTIAARLEQQYPDAQTGRGATVTLFQEEMVQNVRPALLVLLGAVAFVLLIACTNVANLLLARAAARRREIAIRTALGAGRARLIRQFLTESLLLSFLGGAFGLLLARWGVDGLRALAAGYLPRADEVGLDGRVVIFTLLLSALTGIIFGLAPAFQISKTDVQASLKEGGSAGSSPQSNWLRGLLVVAEVASALVLLIGAGLLIKSFLALQRLDPGLKPENVLTMRINLPQAKYNTAQSITSFYQQLLERVSALPGVESAGLVNYLPLAQAGFNGGAVIEGQDPLPPTQMPLVEYRSASPDYFRSLGIPLISGRFFNDQDHEKGNPVAIVNQAFARVFTPDQDPVGKRVRSGIADWTTIVGVVADVKQSGLTQPARAELVLPFTQAQSGLTQTMNLVLRATSDPTRLTAAVRNEVLSIDPNQPIYNVATMQEVIANSVSYSRLNMVLLSIFAGVAMVLSIVGIYSVMSYTVTQNTREIGIRMALGAKQTDVLRLVVGQGLTLTLVGVGIGAAGAFLLTRLMASLLYGVAASDPVTYVWVSAMLVGVAVMASYIPARRATKVDPMVALRYE